MTTNHINTRKGSLRTARNAIIFANILALAAFISIALFAKNSNYSLFAFHNDTFARLDNIEKRVKQIEIQRAAINRSKEGTAGKFDE